MWMHLLIKASQQATSPVSPRILMMNTAGITIVLFLVVLQFQFCTSIYTISSNISIKDTDGAVLISSGQTFAFGFFSAGNDTSARRYVGIWYQIVSERTVVWVANRDNPVNGTLGVLSINDQGNLVLYAGNQTKPVWSTNISAPSNGSSRVQLMDSGNLVLLHQESNKVLWQSFDYPSDTMLPYMELGVDRRTGTNWILSSWKSQDDPGTSNITCQVDPNGFPQLFVYKDLVPLWRGGPWIGTRWAGVPEMSSKDVFNTTFVNNKDEVFLTYSLRNASVISRMMAVSYGASRSTWNARDNRWFEFWSAPKEQCDNYGYCGPNGYCDPYDANSFMCKCFPGFQPKSSRDWLLKDPSGGCVGNAEVSMCQNGEGFVKLTFMKVPDTSQARVDLNMNQRACEQECYRNCSCSAYSSAYENGTGCLMWYGDLIDARKYSLIGQDLYVRVNASELAKYRKSAGPFANRGVQATVIVLIMITLFLILFLVRWWIRRSKRAMKTINSFVSFSRKEFAESGGKDLPLFDLNVIAAATNEFSEENKLGVGGFGSVYKVTKASYYALKVYLGYYGLLYGETEIAVKRLSKNSVQGTEEFKNEVSLIVKLQHRNLVKILGVCVQGQEKMLIYEFLPNKSLDYFIFDERKKSLLDWPTRFNIICGIARGILYLHQDSRLRIIHRDLKASNVLLDASMNPKISDFGMARIFGVDQNEANTNRVVGTYGYMSPEYAMQGLFSVKSDVYSFGVLLLEIITGRKNNSYFEEIANLIGYVWELWKEDRAMDIVDPMMGHSYSHKDILKCIHIGLLCVQDSAADRPTMSTVVFMLGNNNDADLPFPEQPSFILHRSNNSTLSGGICSANEVTITTIEPR